MKLMEGVEVSASVQCASSSCPEENAVQIEAVSLVLISMLCKHSNTAALWGCSVVVLPLVLCLQLHRHGITADGPPLMGHSLLLPRVWSSLLSAESSVQHSVIS